jgi:hypothetical protein
LKATQCCLRRRQRWLATLQVSLPLHHLRPKASNLNEMPLAVAAAVFGAGAIDDMTGSNLFTPPEPYACGRVRVGRVKVFYGADVLFISHIVRMSKSSQTRQERA